jgi:putative effector of murein hydrolase LrgA (UPF0299 family)
MIGRNIRMVFVTLAATILTAGISGHAVAKVHKKRQHAHSFKSARRGNEYRKSVLLVSQQPAGAGVMRYYGGPKSPMWRSSVDN